MRRFSVWAKGNIAGMPLMSTCTVFVPDDASQEYVDAAIAEAAREMVAALVEVGHEEKKP